MWGFSVEAELVENTESQDEFALRLRQSGGRSQRRHEPRYVLSIISKRIPVSYVVVEDPSGVIFLCTKDNGRPHRQPRLPSATFRSAHHRRRPII